MIAPRKISQQWAQTPLLIINTVLISRVHLLTWVIDLVTELQEFVVQWCQQGPRALTDRGVQQQLVGGFAIGVPKPEGELRNVARIAEEETKKEPLLGWQWEMSTGGVIVESQTGLGWKGH